MDLVADAVNGFVSSAIDKVMKAVWAAALWLLRGAFELVDALLGFGDGSNLVDADGRLSGDSPLAGVWPTLLWISGVVALGLFFWQLTTTAARGGAGFWRAVSGPVAYGIAIAMTFGIVAALLGGAEGLTTLLLEKGLDAANFQTLLTEGEMKTVFADNPELGLASQADETVRAVILGLIALFGVIPAAVGFALQMIFRQAVIWILLATIPITAAGLMTQTTSTWFWRSLRWMLAAILMKPALALVLVIGVNLMAAPTGVGGLLVGTGVLLVAVFCPMTIYRLLAFVEPGTQAGLALRSLGSSGSGSGSGAGSGGGSSAEEANTARFDAASGGAGGGAGGGAAGGGAAAGGSGGAAAGGAGAAAGAAGGFAAVGAAVSGAAHGASNYANSQMDASGIGGGAGGSRHASSGQSGQGGSSAGGSGAASQPGGSVAGGDDASAAGGPGSPDVSPIGVGDPGSGAGEGVAAIEPASAQADTGGGPGGGGAGETPPPEQPLDAEGSSGGPGGGAGGAGAGAGEASEAVIP
ncbi:hypothetical protein ACL02T_09895 [Pseudonocardia sp. RS010]|uniref:hypothetical protein n=1 Tax=Pseudonocardia sp. RS010 TaxID=3385979 RepID=UPI00399F94E4